MPRLETGWFWILALIACAPLSAAAGSVEDEIGRVEQMRNQALVDGDVAALDRIYGDEWFYNTASGESVPKTAYLARFRSGAVKVHSLQTEGVQIRVYGDAVMVTGMQHVRATLRGEDRELHLRYLHLYVKRDGAWQLVARQATNLPAPK